MAIQANVAINDSAAATKTFNPRGVKTLGDGRSLGTWREQSAANAEGFYHIWELYSPPNGQKVEKFKWTIDVPTLETVGTNDAGVTPPQTKAYSLQAHIEVLIPTRATATERANIAAYLKNFAALTMVKDAIEDLDPAW